ncbi:hypothetical protein ACIQOU_00845 [Streptomyces sp. NPDC091279]|uniref:hypothetical protein n=1 Tax=Streptomyces sp. NPDC091279 TaxID=3365983 RepID=UPI0038222422
MSSQTTASRNPVLADLGLDPHDENAVVKAFAANSAFRAADWEELTTEDNPYRRPVRPDDLAWLNYARPMPAAKSLKLSALLGHRMLRNVYDAELLYLPPALGGPGDKDGAAFYCERNRVLGALAGPILERHLFAPLDETLGAPEAVTPDTFRQEVRAHHEHRLAEPGLVHIAALSTTDRKASATFFLLQLSAFLPAARAAAGRAALGEFDAAHPDGRGYLLDEYRTWVGAHDSYRTLLAGADLKPAAAAYWQLYLGSSLGRGNHLHHLSRTREKYPEFLGALLHHTLDQSVEAGQYTQVIEDGLGLHTDLFARLAPATADGTSSATALAAVGDLTDRLLATVHGYFGAEGVGRMRRGFAEARWFAELWDEDLAKQLAWADTIPEHQEKAARIDAYLKENNIEVDLDTFVESHEETSTTHVHNEHRLVMVERGQMHFWNNVTHKIELHEGDKVLIPVTRLHGSTVLSGECTYHQPIIPEEMYQRF